MDRLHLAVKPQTFSLSGFDMQGSFANIPYAFFYENAAGADPFLPVSLLKESLSKALIGFPILLGHIRQTATGKISVVVDPNNLNLPEFVDSTCDNISLQDIKSKSFSWDSWPEGVATVGGFAAPAATDGKIRLLNVHAMRLKENSGLILFVNIPHYAVDGSGYFAFIRHWARTSASMLSGQDTSAREDPRLDADRGRIKEFLSVERKALDSISHSMYTTANFFCDTLAWLSPTTLGRLLTKLGSLSSGEAHLFYVSKAKLVELRQSMESHLPSGSRVSDNDILVSLISKTYVQSQPQEEPKPGWFTRAPEKETHFTVRIPSDARPRIGMDGAFTGNLLLPALVRTSMDDLSRPTSPETLASAAMQVRRTIGAIDAPLVAEFYDTVSAHPSSHMRPLAFASGHQTTSMVATSQVRFGMYDADFGLGKPAFVCLTNLFAGSYTMAALMPTAPNQEPGVNVLLTSNAVAMGNMLKNPFWRETVDLLW
ncbi:transferase family protein [Emericellopsis atlantica]|uniref:Transferase family protein n=1 Tax=Emericellopsis atlantica TaxID=2614577 RepID=A0A9P8CJM3_9HYPO|nr:transferase family protein [Emericellopsis atlantica]KAG9249493.1 transferase family protein [Emericellopsis atlantica]